MKEENNEDKNEKNKDKENIEYKITEERTKKGRILSAVINLMRTKIDDDIVRILNPITIINDIYIPIKKQN